MSDATPDRPSKSPKRLPKHKPAGSHHMRAESRLDTDELHCSKGRIADITGSGMRLIIAPKDLPKVGDIQSYTFSDSQEEITISGTIKWVRKGTIFTRRAEIGVEFIKLDPATREAIIRLAIHGDLNLAKDRDIKVTYPDLYKLLGASRYANKAELQAAYEKQANAWDPEHNDDPRAPEFFEEIQKAYSVLGDHFFRKSYDLRFFGPEIDPGNTFGHHPDEHVA